MKKKIFILSLLAIIGALLITVFSWQDTKPVLSADLDIDRKEGVLIPVPVKTGEIIYLGNFVCADTATGFAVVCDDGATYRFLGVAQNSVDNEDGDDGDKTVVVQRTGMFLATGIGLSRTDLGDLVYIVDEATFGPAGQVSSYVPCGRLIEYVSSTKGWIDTSASAILDVLQNADEIPIEDAGSVYMGADVETALQEANSTSAALEERVDSVSSDLVSGLETASSATHITPGDAGAYFPAATNTLTEQIQAIAAVPVLITIPRFTSWTKDGTWKTIALPKFEMSVPVRVKRCYLNLGTAPGSEKELNIKINGTTVVTVSGTNTQAEAESLDIAVAANTDFDVASSETASGGGANADLVCSALLDDGE